MRDQLLALALVLQFSAVDDAAHATGAPEPHLWLERESAAHLASQGVAGGPDDMALASWCSNAAQPGGCSATLVRGNPPRAEGSLSLLPGLRFYGEPLVSLWAEPDRALVALASYQGSQMGIWTQAVSVPELVASQPVLAVLGEGGRLRSLQLARLGTAELAVIWVQENDRGTTVYGRRLDRDGRPSGTVVRLSPPEALRPMSLAVVAPLIGGGLAVAWSEPAGNGGDQVVLQRLGTHLEPLGEPFRSEATRGTFRNVGALASSASGHLALAWELRQRGGGGPVRIEVQVFAPDGSPLGEVWGPVPSEEDHSAWMPRLAWSRSGAELLVVWWQQDRTQAAKVLRAQKRRVLGQPSEPPQQLAEGGPGEQPFLAVRTTGASGFQIIWREPAPERGTRVLRLRELHLR